MGILIREGPKTERPICKDITVQEMLRDSAFSMITDTMPRSYGPVADNLEQRAGWTTEFFRNAFARPELVGWHYCGLIDATNLIARKKDRQHSGLLDGHGRPP